MSAAVPEVAGPLIGFRAFDVDERTFRPEDGYELRGSFRRDFVWEPGRNEATCNQDDVVPHTPPGPHCSCGLYLYTSPAQAARRAMSWSDQVFGVVAVR